MTVHVKYIRPICNPHSTLCVWHAHAANSQSYFSEIFRNRYLQNLDPRKLALYGMLVRTSLNFTASEAYHRPVCLFEYCNNYSTRGETI